MAGLQSDSAPTGGMFQAVKAWFRARGAQAAAPLSLADFGGASKARPGNGSIRVLVVDDNPGNLGAVSELLEQCGICALLAADGAEAVALCSELDFDLILMDLQMPVLDGLAATSAIRRHEALHARPTAAVVAFSSWESMEGLLDACGFSGILRKPCSLLQLEACMVRWCPDYQPCALRTGGLRASPDSDQGELIWRGRAGSSD